MIVVDTNVVSELMRVEPSRRVVAWLDARRADTLFLTTVTLGEVSYGLNVLPVGRRRRRLELAFESFLERGFSHRVLPFDEPAGREYGALMARRREMGRPASTADGQIAGIARSRGYAIATRNVRDFEHCGVELYDPFAD